METANPTNHSSFARKQALEILKQHRQLHRSWRKIAKEDFAGRVNHFTLSRFAKSKGEWIPKSQYIRNVLGLNRFTMNNIKPRIIKVRSSFIDEMTECELKEALSKRSPMPDPDPKIIKAFVKLGWLQPIRTRA
jgi:hypothetical protein